MECGFVDVTTDYYYINDGINIPRLNDWLEDTNHARTGNLVISGSTFKVYYHATPATAGVQETTESIIFQTDGHSLVSAHDSIAIFRKAAKM
jgi:hypothetical protein